MVERCKSPEDCQAVIVARSELACEVGEIKTGQALQGATLENVESEVGLIRDDIRSFSTENKASHVEIFQRLNSLEKGQAKADGQGEPQECVAEINRRLLFLTIAVGLLGLVVLGKSFFGITLGN